LGFSGTKILYKTTGYPTGPNDGTLVVDKLNTPGSNDTFRHTNLPGGVVHYYAGFAHDVVHNFSAAATVSETPANKGDLDLDGDSDQEDFGLFQVCYSGDGQMYETDCQDADLDNDNDVDLSDFAVFETCMNGSNNPPGC
jgi:hypothetical protein